MACLPEGVDEQTLPRDAGEVGVLFASAELWRELAGPDSGARYLVVVPPTTVGAAAPAEQEAPPAPGAEPADDEERRRLVAALAAHRWRREQTAAALGVSRTTLWRRMRHAGLTG